MLVNDRQIKISSAGSRKSTVWPAQTLYWSELVEKLRTPVRSVETLAEYLKYPKSKQDDLKDVGGFVAGTLAGNRRKNGNVLGRDVITLDLDNIPGGQTVNVLQRIEGLGCAYAVYSTRKHEESKPRLRVLLPTDRTSSADEYEPIARKIASIIGIELCDPTTFQALRLMYWPSCSSDGVYVYQYGDKPFLSVDGLLSTYVNWRNILEWPQVPGTDQLHVRLAAKQGNPLEKPGVVGAFCKSYDIYNAIETFLPGVYTECDIPGRLTFTGGSTTGGAVVYDNDSFIFSHHATDPAGGKLCNAFDLVRLHKFGEQDDDAKPDTPVNKLPSYAAMCQFAISDSNIATLINQEKYDKALEEFGQSREEDDTNWRRLLTVSATTGANAKTTNNVLVILENDPLLKGKIAFDEFANRGLVLGSLPWNMSEERRTWSDIDDAGLRHYIEKFHGITGKERIFDAIALCAHKNRLNAVKSYLTGLEWDGVKRVDTLLTDYLGAKDSIYTRAAIRKSLCAAVARVMTTGVKFDNMIILAGAQGIGKSTFLRILGKDWFSDSLQTFEGKEASEMLQGTWINEVGELSGLNRSETNAVKNFLARVEDIYREPFGRRTATFPRKCVFFGTTNDYEFLKDATGNRRFWPIDVGVENPTKSVFDNLAEEVDQVWAEAFLYWQLGEKLYLQGKALEEAEQQQEEHSESNTKEGIIREFVERRVPFDWDKRNLGERRLYWSNEFDRVPGDTMERDRICAAEIWCECFGADIKYMKRLDSLEINAILSKIKGWKKHNSTFRFGCYGIQKGYIRL